MVNQPRATKYIGWCGDSEPEPVTARTVDRIILANRQYGTVRETRAACRRILRRGDTITDGHTVVRLRILPA